METENIQRDSDIDKKKKSRSGHFAKVLAAGLTACLSSAVLTPMMGTTAMAEVVEPTDKFVATSWSGDDEKSVKNIIKNNGRNALIEISEDLIADNTIEITEGMNVKITSDGKTVYRKDGAKFDSLFSVKGGNLTLGEGVTFSGKVKSVTEGKKGQVCDETATLTRYSGTKLNDGSKPADGKDYVIALSNGRNNNGDGAIISAQKDSDKLTTIARPADFAKLTAAEVDSLKNAVWHVTAYDGVVGNNEAAYVFYNESTGRTLVREWPGEDYDRGDSDVKAYTTEQLDGVASYEYRTDSTKYLSGNDSVLFFQYTYPGNANTRYLRNDGDGDDVVYDPITAHIYENASWLKKAPHPWIYEVIFDFVYPEGDANAGQTGCVPTDGTEGDTKINNHSYTKDEISEGKGFFVDVESGTFSLTGATLSDFETESTVSNVAPIYAHGGKATMTSGLIENNIVGYTATEDMNNKKANELKDIFKGDKLARTETAGAMILTNGATGSISGGTIKNNKADTGAIVVAGSNNDNKYGGTATTFEITGTTDIYHNTGVHHAGAVYVYNGADVTMTGGRIADNFAWYKGGGVWVSEEAYNTTRFMQVGSTKYVGDASFTMQGGEIVRNTATCRAGAIEVESNHVALLNGTLSNNYSRELGGAIYVEGDSEDHMYQLYIEKGHIYDNAAATDNNINNTLNNKGAKSDHALLLADETNTGDYKDYNGYQGFGGGVWLCAFGGNATIDASDSVIINNNTADTKGNDLKLRPTSRNAGSAVNIIEAAGGKAGSISSWIDERNNSSIELGKSYTGPLPITNNDKTSTAEGIQIHNNVARVGGGIAANGTVVFGVEDVELFRLRTQFDIAKDWDVAPEEGTNANFVISIQDKDGNKIGESYEVALNGKADAEEGVAIENEAVYESTAWVASFGIPLTVTCNDGSVVPVFTFEYEGKTLDPSNIEDQKTIYELIRAGKLTKDNAKLGEWKISIEESVSGTSNTYTMTKDDVSLNNAEAEVTRESTITDKAGNELAKITEKTIKLSFAQGVHNKKYEENPEKPQVEKYINNKVHQTLSNFDEEFEYEIMAYVPKSATEVTVSDTLEPSLDFVYTDDAQTKVVNSIVAFKENDHKGDETGTVKNNSGIRSFGKVVDGTRDKDDYSVNVDKNNRTVSVTLKDGILNSSGDAIFKNEAKELEGFWLKVSFKAKYNKEYHDLNKVKTDAGWMDEADKAGDTSLELDYVKANAEVRRNKGNNNVIILIDGKYFRTNYGTDGYGKTWEDVTKDTSFYQEHWAGDNTLELVDSSVIEAVEGVKGYNGSVIDAQNPHAGTKNQATYTVKIGDNAASEYKTNIVTVEPKEEEKEHEVKINKTDMGGNEVEGAVIKVTGTGFEQTWTSKKNETMNITVPEGEYALIEVNEPAGYQKVTTEIKFEVDKSGNVTVKTTNVEPAGACEVVNGVLVLKDEINPEIRTTATDNTDGDKQVTAESKAQVKDVVKYSKLIAGKKYTMEGQLVKKSDKSVVATASKEFVAAEGGAGEVELVFEFDASALAGQSAVAFETAKDGDDVVAVHADLEDADQTVDIVKPEVKTTAEDAADQDKKLEAAETVTVKDIVEYKNLTKGKEYTLSGKLVTKSSNGETVVATSEKKFTPDAANGTVELEFTLNTSELKGEKLVVFETVTYDNKEVAVHADINDEAQTVEVEKPEEPPVTPEEPEIRTTATDNADGDKQVTAESKAQVKDVVKYDKLIAGKTYTMEGQLVKKSDKSVVATASKEFVAAEGGAGEVELVFEFDASALAGQSAVAFETAKDGDDVVAVHADLEDADQTVEIVKPEVKTTAEDKADQDKTLEAAETVTVKDIVEYKNLTKGKEYTLSGKLVTKSSNGETVVKTAEKKFTPDAANGTVELEFTLNTSELKGEKLVVFETVTYNNKEVAVHADINDEAQTVEVEKPEEAVSVNISKSDLDGTEVPGATIKVTGEDFEETWVSTNESHELTLKPGKYTLVEEIAPEGFKKVTTTIEFTVDENGNVELLTAEVENGKVAVKEDGTLVLFDEPDETPEIEKYVGQAVHKDIRLDDRFTYDIIAYITKDADDVTITDELVADLAFAGKAEEVKVVDLGETDNHKVSNDIFGNEVNKDATVALEGTAVEGAKAVISDRKLTVTIPDATKVRGHFVKVTFDAKIAEGKTIEDLRQVTIKENTPVLSDEEHTGVDNKASYEIGVKKLVLDENGHPTFDENGNVVKEDKTTPKYEDESNTVTVKPEEEVSVNISKADLDGTEVPGATIKVTGEDFEETWVSTNESHELTLKPGKYTLVEEVAPEGFKKVTTAIEFTVDKDGKVEVLTQAVENGKVAVREDGTLVLFDEPETVDVKISKVDIAGNEIEGAQIEIRDTMGEVVESWTSATEVHELTLKPGTYVFHEEAAPHGYVAVTDVVFSVDENGVVTVETVEANYALVDENGVLVITDDYMPHNVSISKADLDGTEVPGATITVTGKDFTETWVSTDKSHNLVLKPGTYTLVEDVAPAGFKKVTTSIEFTVDINGNVEVLTQKVENGKVAVKEDGTLVLFDEPEIEYIDIPVVKTWVGSEADEAAPESVTVRLLKNGKEISFAVLTKENGWAHTFTGLVKSEGGKENTYTITEDAVDNYTSEINGYNVTNTYTPGKTTVNVYKTWTGDDAGRRPLSIVVNLLADGVVAASKTVSAEDNWFTTFTELPILNEAGARINYTVEEQPVAGYTGTVTGSADTSYVINNDRIRVNVNISKQAVGGGPELEGATLVVADEEGNEIERWVSGKEAHVVEALPTGVYTLTEITAPKGYEIAETITFRVNDDGSTDVKAGDTWADAEGLIVMFDALKDAEIIHDFVDIPDTPEQPEIPAPEVIENTEVSPAPEKPENEVTPVPEKPEKEDTPAPEKTEKEDTPDVTDKEIIRENPDNSSEGENHTPEVKQPVIPTTTRRTVNTPAVVTPSGAKTASVSKATDTGDESSMLMWIVMAAAAAAAIAAMGIAITRKRRED